MSEWLEPDVAQKWRLMILGWPFHIVDMTTEGSTGDHAQPIRMVEKPEIFFNLNMTHIVPVADMWRGDLFEQSKHFALRRNLLITAASFDAEPNISCSSMRDDRWQRFLDPVQRSDGPFFSLSHRCDFFANIIPG